MDFAIDRRAANDKDARRAQLPYFDKDFPVDLLPVRFVLLAPRALSIV
jgi:hypothetical protein